MPADQAERLSALKAYIAKADDPTHAREFVLELLDPETDADLLDFLAEPDNQQNQ